MLILNQVYWPAVATVAAATATAAAATATAETAATAADQKLQLAVVNF